MVGSFLDSGATALNNVDKFLDLPKFIILFHNLQKIVFLFWGIVDLYFLLNCLLETVLY